VQFTTEPFVLKSNLELLNLEFFRAFKERWIFPIGPMRLHFITRLFPRGMV
jgi:hypothetical protein